MALAKPQYNVYIKLQIHGCQHFLEWNHGFTVARKL